MSDNEDVKYLCTHCAYSYISKIYIAKILPASLLRMCIGLFVGLFSGLVRFGLGFFS